MSVCAVRAQCVVWFVLDAVMCLPPSPPTCHEVKGFCGCLHGDGESQGEKIFLGELPHETGLILRCAWKVGNPLQTEKGQKESDPAAAHEMACVCPRGRALCVLTDEGQAVHNSGPLGPSRPLGTTPLF